MAQIQCVEYFRPGRVHHLLSFANPAYIANCLQVVCGCMGSVISVWDVETGEKIIQFSKVHGDREITSMTFDPSGRRLLTGGRDGKVKIWNFNNGACLSEIYMGDTSEVLWNVIQESLCW